MSEGFDPSFGRALGHEAARPVVTALAVSGVLAVVVVNVEIADALTAHQLAVIGILALVPAWLVTACAVRCVMRLSGSRLGRRVAAAYYALSESSVSHLHAWTYGRGFRYRAWGAQSPKKNGRT